MTPETKAERAERFARNLKIRNFIVANAAVRELYGTFEPALDERKLRAVYERNEPNSCWRDFGAFLSCMHARLEALATIPG